MRIFKSHPLLKLVNSYVIDSPQPSNLSYLWNFGSLLSFCLIIQIVTGVTLAMHYSPTISEAFNSVEHIMRDVNNGWLIRYLHSNTASAFFFLVYLHIGRGLYYGSYRAPRTLVWTIGTVIFILMIATAFLGYEHSPKWYKLNNSYHISSNYNLLLRGTKQKLNKFNLNSKRYNSILVSPLILEGYHYTQVKSKILTDFFKEKNLKPIYSYENLELDYTKKKIKSETINLSGIYLILNKVTLDYYIGSASTNKFYVRFYNHLFNFNGSRIVKAAVRKYNISEFAFIILELFPEVVIKQNNKKLLDLEDFYLKSLLPNYNILTEAGSNFGYKHTEITRIKMKSNYSTERRLQIGNLNKYKKFSKETIEIMRASVFNREKPFYSGKAMLNMKKKSKSLIFYNLNYTVYGQYPSITEAAKYLNCNEKTITRALKTEKKLLKRRLIVKYV